MVIELYANTYYSYLDKLVKLYNKLLRILQCKTRRSNVLDLYENYNVLPLPHLHQFSVLVFVHKFVHHRDTLPDPNPVGLYLGVTLDRTLSYR